MTTVDSIPATATRLAEQAREQGWTVTIRRTSGTPIDASGNPERRTERRPMVDANTGAPLMTAGSPATDKRKAVPPRQRVEVVRLDEHKVIDSVVVRFTRGDVVLVGVWEDGAWRVGLRQSPFSRLSVAELQHILKGGKVASTAEAIYVTCPTCGAEPDHRCTNAQGKHCLMHNERVAAAS